MSDRAEFEKACPVPEGVYWESWGNGDGQYEAVSPEHEEFADVQQARLQGWQAARAQGGQGAEPVAWTWTSGGRHVTADKSYADQLRADGVNVQPLYTHPQPAVPEGYVIMPEILPNEVVKAFAVATVGEWDSRSEDQRAEVTEKLQLAFDAMVAAAQPPKQEGE